MGEWDSYIDAVVAVDELGTLPPLESEPEYNVDSDTWALYFEYEDPIEGGNDMVTLHFDSKQDAILTANKISSDRHLAMLELEREKAEKAKKALDKQS